MYLFFFLLSLLSPSYASATCDKCITLQKEMTQLIEDGKKSQGLLDQNKTVLDTLADKDTSKKVKLTSNIFILTVRLETINNNITIKSKELETMRCAACPNL